MNFDDIRAKLAGLANQGQKRKDLWKPKDKHVIRLLPYPHGDEPFIELAFHYDIGKTRSLLCPQQTDGEVCPICEFAEQLKNWNDADGNEKQKSIREADWELFKKIQAKPRYYVPMIERDSDDQTPKFWAFGKTIYERLLGMCLDEEMNDVANSKGTGVLCDVNGAFDLKIDFKKPNNEDKKGNTKNWPSTDVENKLKVTKVAASKKEIKEILDAIIDIKDVYPVLSSKEVNKIFMDFVNSSGTQSEEDVKDPGTEYKSNTAEKPVEGGQSIDEAFGALTEED